MNSRIIIFLFFTTSISFSQELLTPEEAIKIALQNNYSISIARNEAEIAANNSSLGNAGFFPNLEATGSYSKSINNTRQEFFSGEQRELDGAKSSTLTAGISLNWTIFDGLRMFASLDRLKALNKTGELNFKFEVENNIKNYTNVYKNNHVFF